MVNNKFLLVRGQGIQVSSANGGFAASPILEAEKGTLEIHTPTGHGAFFWSWCHFQVCFGKEPPVFVLLVGGRSVKRDTPIWRFRSGSTSARRRVVILFVAF